MDTDSETSTARPHHALEHHVPNPNFLSGWRLGAFLTVLVLINVLAFVDRLLPFVLAESIKTDLNLSDTQLGILNGAAFSIVYVFAALPLARLADGRHPKLVLAACLVVWSGMTALGGLATGFVTLAATRLGVAFGEASATPGAHTLINRKVEPGRRGMALGLFSMGTPVGTMVGLAVGGLASQLLTWRQTLVGAGAVGFMITLLFMLLVPSADALVKPQAGRRLSLWATLGSLFQSSTYRWLCAGLCLTGIGLAPFYAFSSSFLIRIHGFSVAEAGVTIGILQGGLGILGTIGAGRVFDRATTTGRHRLLLFPVALSLLISCPAFVAALLVSNGSLAAILLAPLLFAAAFILPGMFGTAHLVTNPQYHGTASGVLVLATGFVGGTLGPAAVGFISDLATNAGLPDGLRWGLFVIPIAVALGGSVLLVAAVRVIRELSARTVSS